MKIKTALCQIFVVVLLFANGFARGQGTITFDAPSAGGGYIRYQNYYEQGVWFRVVAPAPNTPYGEMLQVASIFAPSNGSQYMLWNNSSESVVFSMINGSSFGLTSIDLGNVVFSGQSSLAVTFNGYYVDGSMVSATFNTPNNNLSTFTTYNFGAAFASGLSRVEMPSQFWVMDNLVVVPEPSIYALFGLGLFAVGFHKFNQLKRM